MLHRSLGPALAAARSRFFSSIRLDQASAAMPASLLVLLGAAGSPAVAQTVTSLETVVVSGTRTAVPASELGSTMTVVTGEELDAKQIRIVSDALRAVPGLAVNRSGPAGTFTQVRIRGAEANHTVVLIDGMKINDPFSSEVDFAHLLSAQVDRIEILRGPQSVLYGSEAIGGVISIFTKRGTAGTQVEGSLEAGSFSTVAGSAALRGANEAFDYSLSVNGLRTDGTNVSRFGSEDDGYRNKTVLGSARWKVAPAFTLDASLRWRDNRTQFDPQDFGFPPGPNFGLVVDGDRHTDSDQLDARLRGQLLTLDGRLEHQFGVARSKTTADSFADGAFDSGSEGERTRFDYQGSLRFGGVELAQVFTLALERENLKFVNKGPTPASAENQTRENDKTGIALEYRVRLATLTALALSARHDRHDLFEDATTYRATVAQPLGNVKLRASVGSGVTNPTFFELFGFIPGTFDPNPNLKPEESVGFDVGADVSLWGGAGQLSVTYFDADLENEITGTFDSTTFRSSTTNLSGKSKRKGVEIESRFNISMDWSVAAAYTYTDSKQPDGQPEVRRPRHIAAASVSYTLPDKRGGLTLAVDHNGRQQDLDFRSFTSARVVLKDYTLVRLAGHYAITPNIDITARVENALDTKYEEVFSHRATGRAYYAGVNVRF
ncbi:MAG: TonB-dependent receptor plug domain-containing protein [Armatimonadota bacterium]